LDLLADEDDGQNLGRVAEFRPVEETKQELGTPEFLTAS
jgi:hypothetical protein